MRLYKKYMVAEKKEEEQEIELKPIKDVYAKAIRAVESAKTEAQFETAKQYMRNFQKLYLSKYTRALRSSIAKGMFMELGKLYKKKEKELGIKKDDWYDRYLKAIGKK